MNIALNNEVKNIINTLCEKSKRSFVYRKRELKKQALYFSPFYRDFIHKVIKNTSLKIVYKWNDGYIISNSEPPITNKLNKRGKNKIYVDINQVDTLPHELGHAVDFWFGEYLALTSNVILSNHKTLKETFDGEFKSKKEDIYQLVMNEYKSIINSNINDDAYDILTNNMSVYLKLQSIKQSKDTLKIRRKLQNQLYKSGFVETYYHLYDRKCFQILNRKYSPILDALSSQYDLDGLFLDHHKYEYYKDSKNKPVQEFFANLFEAKVTSKHLQFDNLIKLLPQSFETFEELFSIFYQHIKQNKRFTDVKVRKEMKYDEL